MSDFQRTGGPVYFVAMVTRLLAVLALVAAAATAAFIAGQHTVKRDDRWLQGYHAGVRAERNATRENAKRETARYLPGQPGFEAIYSAGRREGQRLGQRLGRSAGLSDGRRTGFKAGRAEALPTFPGGWRAQHWYLVRLEPGRGSRVQVGQRVVVSRGRLYGACTNNPDKICAAPQN
jgi:hypothetical protein